MVIVKNSSIHGKGVFAAENILPGTILECDILEIPKGRIIESYIFPFIGDRVCLHIGFASFFNSSKKPNVKHTRIDTFKMKSYFEVLVYIEVGEELTLNYM